MAQIQLLLCKVAISSRWYGHFSGMQSFQLAYNQRHLLWRPRGKCSTAVEMRNCVCNLKFADHINKTQLCRASPDVSRQITTTATYWFVKKDRNAKGTTGKSNSKKHIMISTEEINKVIRFDDMKLQMEAALEYLQREYADKLLLNISIGQLYNLDVETSEGHFPLIQLAQIVEKSPMLLMINTTSGSYINNVKTALLAQGLSSIQDGPVLFVTLPKASKERREALAKTAKQLCEKSKEKIRNISARYSKDLRKVKGDFSEDLVFRLNEALISTTKEYMEKANDILKAKQKGILGD